MFHVEHFGGFIDPGLNLSGEAFGRILSPDLQNVPRGTFLWVVLRGFALWFDCWPEFGS